MEAFLYTTLASSACEVQPSSSIFQLLGHVSHENFTGLSIESTYAMIVVCRYLSFLHMWQRNVEMIFHQLCSQHTRGESFELTPWLTLEGDSHVTRHHKPFLFLFVDRQGSILIIERLENNQSSHNIDHFPSSSSYFLDTQLAFELLD